MLRQTLSLWLALFALCWSVAANAMVQRSLCVWDLLGANGETYNLMKDYRVAARAWGVDFTLRSYSEEKIAAEDFRVGQCDAMVVTGLRTKPFNGFTGSLESIGTIPSYKHLRLVIGAMSSSKAAKLMTSGAYEVVGVMPFGGIYFYVNDRNINDIGKLAGKKIAYFDYDKSQGKLLQQIGAQAMPSDVTNFAPKFNNGAVDIIFAPAAAYRPLELYRGMGKNGGIPDFLLAQSSLQIVIRSDKYPPGFGQSSRNYIYGQYDRILSVIQKYESDIDPKYWFHIPDADRARYVAIMRESRINLAKDGLYDRRLMALLKRVRCQLEPGSGECSENLE